MIAFKCTVDAFGQVADAFESTEIGAIPSSLSPEESHLPSAATPAPRLARPIVTTLAALSFALHVAVNFVSPYGVHRDEFLYMAMGRHLQLWRMDFPPLIAIASEMQRALLGDSLVAIRMVPALAGALLIVLAALLAREMGGGRAAQALAALCVLGAPLFMRTAILFQPVVLDELWWTVALLALARLANGGDRRWWLALGTALGLGLLTKFSIGVIAIAVSVAIVLSPLRRALLTAWPWLAALLALVIGSPSIVGQIRLGFPVMRQMSDLQQAQLSHVTPAAFLGGQAEMLGPAVLLAAAGLAVLLAVPWMRAWRVLGWSCLGALTLLL
ncbi:MAG: glycosyltransferase family 39 protein, partial [Gemmatimonadota bacterium]